MDNNIKTIDENLAAIHGYLCSDGYVVRNPPKQKHIYYYVALKNTNLILLKDFQKKFKQVFAVKPKITNQLDRCIIGSKKFYFHLIKTFGSFYCREWTMPVEKMDKKAMSFWLRAFFDCESSVYLKERQSRLICMESVNHKGLNQIKEQLQDSFGIPSMIKKRKNRLTHELFIYGKENLIKFRKEIGFLHPTKKEKLDKAIASYVTYEWFFPKEKEELKAFVVNLMSNRVKSDKNGKISICSNIRENLVSLSEALKELFDIETKVSNACFNGAGTRYFEIAINQKVEINKLFENNLVSEENRNGYKIS